MSGGQVEIAETAFHVEFTETVERSGSFIVYAKDRAAVEALIADGARDLIQSNEWSEEATDENHVIARLYVAAVGTPIWRGDGHGEWDPLTAVAS